ncbi:Crp/Fnr family transcriptional regulator [Oricola cellulosilytica]|uniref:Crp/Fnr family transcriptional regulator n=1 Tax=Oricola cellulosilytica TaxID=1429082 RepID=A0A4R0PDW0_9HYPH|nr:Crp/Fnr family transcriptional regulator [Oricola cellulosilytica]TCD14519.1 Crp/Fnr family transcriptional regulator [Oricola cellulosilytica]
MDSLKSFELFASLNDAQDKRFSAMARTSDFGENELVVDYEDETRNVFLIRSGRVRVILRIATGREVILGEFAEGECFGELAAIDGTTRSANVTAMVNTRVATLPQAVFLEILRENPDVALELMRSMSALIRSLNTRLAEHAFLPAKYRLYSELIRLSKPRKSPGDGISGQRIISPPPIQLELAERIGCRREVVSREIAKMEREKVVERSRGGLILADMAELNRRLSEGWDAGGG